MCTQARMHADTHSYTLDIVIINIGDMKSCINLGFIIVIFKLCLLIKILLSYPILLFVLID
jgi:hypothetical protein